MFPRQGSGTRVRAVEEPVARDAPPEQRHTLDRVVDTISARSLGMIELRGRRQAVGLIFGRILIVGDLLALSDKVNLDVTQMPAILESLNLGVLTGDDRDAGGSPARAVPDGVQPADLAAQHLKLYLESRAAATWLLAGRERPAAEPCAGP